jgi:HPt (histidine-containing phosphotransfer) domain-containing protein
VHTLKSSAALLGKTELSEAAAQAESLLEDGKNQLTQEHLDVLKKELTVVLEELEPVVKEYKPSPAEVKILSTDEAQETLAQLKPLLESGNSNCMKYIDKLRGIQGADEPLVRKLIQQIEDLDFEEALETFCKFKVADTII